MRIASMTTTALAVFLTLAGGTAAEAQAQAASATVAYINSQQILRATPAVAEAQTALQQDLQQYQAQVDSMQQEMQQMLQQFQQQQLTLSAEAKAQRQQEIQAKQAEYQERVQQLDQQAAQREQELMQPIMTRISDVIEEIRVERGYALVFDAATQAIIAADSSLDITQVVIQRLSAQSDTTATGPGGN